jgi:hypothetical protein
MVGEIAASAGDAGAVWARRMHLNGGRGERERRAARILLIVRPAEQVVERLFRIVEGARPGFDQPREVGGSHRFGQFSRVRLVVLLGGVFGEGAAEIGDRAVPQHAGALLRTIDDDLHTNSPP